MASSRFFAYNPIASPPTGASQYGDVAIEGIGFDFNSGSLEWYNGPDETTGYVISHSSGPRTAANGSIEIPGNTIGFWRTTSLSDVAFINLANRISTKEGNPQTFLTALQAKNWLNDNHYWTSYPAETLITQFNSIGVTTWTAPSSVKRVEYLVVAGGGGGGNGYDTGGGGGGAGGMVLSGFLDVSPGETLTIQVGFGGTGGAGSRTNISGTDGGDSKFGSITSLGGKGGSGSRSTPGGVGVGGSTQSGSISAPTGGNGGGNASSAKGGCGGGGGGAGGVGGNGNGTSGNPISGGTGGSGISSSITGSSVTYGAGGAGARGNILVTGAIGNDNLGKGGGGGACGNACAGAGGNGGSGTVILKYSIL